MSTDAPAEVKDEPDKEYIGEGDVELLPYEQHTLLDTMADDVLFISARGLGLERLFLNHLIMYSDQKLLFLVINTNEHDEAYFLSKLKEHDIPCQPKLINSDVSVKDRESIYLEGGVQFITSRILLMDLLTSRIPVNHVAGILVWRAHQVLSTFQDSFILRLYREKKKGGFVKAFTDVPTQCSALGQLQRLIDRLYVKKVVILPRFHELVRESLDCQSITEWSVHLPQTIRRIHSTLYDIIRVCLRELKQVSTTEKLAEDDDVSEGIFAYMPTAIEKQLLEKRSHLTDKQRRLISDLEILRGLLSVAQDMDPATLLHKLNSFRNDKEAMLERSGGWLLTPTAGKLIADIETLCSARTFQAPPKWRILSDVLAEVKEMKVLEEEVAAAGTAPSILVFVSNEQTCRQVADLVRNGPAFVEWMAKRLLAQPGREPEKTPMWPPEHVSMYMRSNLSAETRGELKTGLQKDQKEVARAARKRRKFAEDMMLNTAGTSKQTKISQFGILQYKKRALQGPSTSAAPVEPKEEPLDEDDVQNTEVVGRTTEPKALKDFPNVQVVITPVGEKYNTLRYLDDKKPNVIILYNSDVGTIRTVEVYSACNPGVRLVVHQLMYVESTEEQRYLTVINNETKAFEAIVREKANLLIPRTYDVLREDPPTLSVRSRDAGGQQPQRLGRPLIVVDMREFNSELPTVLYKKGFDVEPVTLEVGDYVLSPGIAVERKALDDLYQSLQSGRVLKQSEQMLRHYANAILLVESNKKFDSKKVNGGPFQGELSRHCREIRALFCQLIRSHPKLKIVWSQNPASSADFFAELKMGKEDPDVERAVAIRADEVAPSSSSTATDDPGKKRKANPVILRHLTPSLPRMARGDVERMMVSGQVRDLKELLTSSATQLYAAVGHHADAINLLATFDFRQQDA